MKNLTIALLGQPNSGKSTLFNGLTGAKQHVGNWPGKTVEKKEGYFGRNGVRYTLVDLPGSYGLSANSDEEVITREYITSGKADVVALIADASQLNRSLFMLADFAGINVPVVLLMNMMDIAAKQGKTVDIKGFEKELGVPVVPIVAADKAHYKDLFAFLDRFDGKSALKTASLEKSYESVLGKPYTDLTALLSAKGIGAFSRMWLAAKLIEKDIKAVRIVEDGVPRDVFKKIEEITAHIANGSLDTGSCKFEWIDSLIASCVRQEKTVFKRSAFDKLATSKRWGKPLAVGIIMLGLILSMLIGFPFMGLFAVVIPKLSALIAKGLLTLGVSQVLISLLCGAVMTAVTFAFQMASFVFGISLVFGFMEDIGYMARVSYVFDNTMSKIGLQGKAVMPFLVSFGCNIGGVTGSRIIDSWQQRIMTIALSWVIPCGATWGVVGFISGTFFGARSIFVVLGLLAVALLHLIITYNLFKKSLYAGKTAAGMIMELPPYHKPHWKNLFLSVFDKMGDVFGRALSIIILISVGFWLLSFSPSGNISNSVIYKIGTVIEPVTRFFGLPWQLFMAFVASAMGKESALGVLASLFSSSAIWQAVEVRSAVDTVALSSDMLSAISKPEALAFLFAFFFNMPCLMTLAATAQETHSKKWTVGIALYYIFFALILAFAAYRIGLLLF